jgi:hypothetical protein
MFPVDACEQGIWADAITQAGRVDRTLQDPSPAQRKLSGLPELGERSRINWVGVGEMR